MKIRSKKNTTDIFYFHKRFTTFLLVTRFIIIYIKKIYVFYILEILQIHLNLIKCSIFWCQAPKGAFLHAYIFCKNSMICMYIRIC